MKLIDKAAVVAEIERRIEALKETLKNCDSSISEIVLKGSMSAYQIMLHFLNTIEVKEVDLNKEFESFLDNIEGVPRMWHSDEQIEWAKDIAKHFFELGLKAQKGE